MKGTAIKGKKKRPIEAQGKVQGQGEEEKVRQVELRTFTTNTSSF
jgi:hypothetical protein